MRALIVGVVLILLCTVFFFRKEDRPTKSSEEMPPESSSGGEIQVPENNAAPLLTSASGAAVDLSNKDGRFTRFVDGTVIWNSSVKLSRELHQSEKVPRHDLEIVAQLLNDYRAVFRENPVGVDNEEVIAALTGKNPKQVTFIDLSLLKDGQLLDRWGSPYRFHALTADQMEVQSLGPDQKLWTKDDLSLGAEE